MAVDAAPGVLPTREAPAAATSLLRPEVAKLARSIGFPSELGNPESLFVRRDGGLTGNALNGLVRSGGFEPDSTMGKAVIDAARAMNPGRRPNDTNPALVFDVSRLDGQPIEVRAKAWSALRRMTDTIAPPPPPAPAVAGRVPDGAAPIAAATKRPVLAAPGQSPATTLPDHRQLSGVSVDFRAAFAQPENQRLVFAMLLERQPKSLREGLDAIEARYPSASFNVQQVLSRVQTGLKPFGYQGNQKGIPNRQMSSSLAFAREQVRPAFREVSTRNAASDTAQKLGLDPGSDLMAAIEGGLLGWRAPV